MQDQPGTSNPSQDGAQIQSVGTPVDQAAEGKASTSNLLDTLASRIGRLESEVAELRREAATQPDHPEKIAEAHSRIWARMTEISYGNGVLNVGPNTLSTAQGEMDAHTAALSSHPLPGALESHQSRHLLIPIHAPKFNYISSMFAWLKGEWDHQEIRCTFIATSTAERELAERYVRLARPVMPKNYEIISAAELASSLGMNELVEAIVENREGGIINMKKMVALYRAYCEGADEVCCIDADSAFLRPLDQVFEKCAQNYEKKIFAASSSRNEIAVHVIDHCSSYFSSNDRKKLDKLYAKDLYSWFFDIPYYVRNDVFGFFNHITYLYGGLENALKILRWHHFDHILYLNYLILRGDFALCDVSPFVTAGRLSDEFLISDLESIERVTGLTPAWANLSALLSDREPLASQNFHAISHVDRLI